MKITFTILLGCFALTMMSFLISKEDPPLYKNLKVLPKNITKDQMDSVMHHFAEAMGKKCNFCHVFNNDTKKMDFASDAKDEKATARQMWTMTAKINQKFFDVKDSKHMETRLTVTCFTCHHGSEHPDSRAPKRDAPSGGSQAGGQAPGGNQSQGMAPASTDSSKH